MESIVYLGPDGSFSHMAAKVFKPNSRMIAEGSFYAVMRRLLRGEADYAVMPILNSINGGVVQNIDLLQANDCVAVQSLPLKIEHRFATLKGADPRAVNRIFSHSQALEQCAKFLADTYPDAKLIAVSSTVQGAKSIQLPTDGAIAPADCGVENLQFSPENIADERDNYTTFLLVKRGCADEETHSKKVYFSATCRHEPGALCRLLEILSKNQINMTKIESRPIKDHVGEFRFFVEIEGDYASDKIKRALDEIKESASSFKILGVY